MTDYTTRFSLAKPTGAEPRSVTPLNANADIIDKFMGMKLVNDGTAIPDSSHLSDGYDGQVIREKTSGIIYELRLASGVYVKNYIRYPYCLVAYGSGVKSFGTTPVKTGFATLAATACVNANAGDLDASKFWIVPTNGIYSVSIKTRWDYNIVGNRYAVVYVNNDIKDIGAENNVLANSSTGYCNVAVELRELLHKGDLVSVGVWQNSGGDLTLSTYISATLIEPVA